LQWCASEVAIRSGLDSALGSHPFAAVSFLSEIVIREIERRTALGLGAEPSQADSRVWSIGCREQVGWNMVGASPPPRRRRKVIQAFFAISLETEQPYRITEDCDLRAIVPEDDDVLVSIYLDGRHELLAEKATFFACTRPLISS